MLGTTTCLAGRIARCACASWDVARACSCVVGVPVLVCVCVIRVLGNRARAKSSRGSQFWIGLVPFRRRRGGGARTKTQQASHPPRKRCVWGGACQRCGRHKPRRPQAHDTRHWARSKVLGERRRREATSKKRARREVSAQRRSKLAGASASVAPPSSKTNCSHPLATALQRFLGKRLRRMRTLECKAKTTTHLSWPCTTSFHTPPLLHLSLHSAALQLFSSDLPPHPPSHRKKSKSVVPKTSSKYFVRMHLLCLYVYLFSACTQATS